MTPTSETPRKFFSPVPVLILVYLYNGFIALRQSIDIPFMDEWDCWWKWFPGEPLKWVIARHNEHRIVFTKLEFLLVNFLAHGNEIWLLFINYALFGGLVTILYRRITRLDPLSRIAGWFVVFLLSSQNYENHTCGFQSQFHYTLLFFWLALPLLFDVDRRKYALGWLLMIATAYSFGSGVMLCAVALASAAIYRRSWYGFAAGVVLLVLWSLGRPQHPLPHVSPFRLQFWTFFLTMLGKGFGFAGTGGVVWGLFWFLVCIAAWIYVAYQFGGQEKRRVWVGCTAVAAFLSAIAAMAYGRAAIHLDVALSSRYTEFTFMLIPLTAVGMGWALRKHSQVRKGVLVFFAVSMAVVFAKKFSSMPYDLEWSKRAQGVECLRRYFRTGEGQANCANIYPAPIADKLEALEKEQPSWMTKLRDTPKD